MSILLVNANAVNIPLANESVQCVVTSPPYYGLRDYGIGGQIGLEETPEQYVSKLVAVFREVWRVLKNDGTLWLNLGDSYNSNASNQQYKNGFGRDNGIGRKNKQVNTLKSKDLLGIPWLVAFALRQPWHFGPIKKLEDRMWLAGLTDGEGCLTILEAKSSHDSGNSYPPIYQIRMCDVGPLEHASFITGYGNASPRQEPPSQGGQRGSYQWRLNGRRAADIAAEVYPYLYVKQKQAIILWNQQAIRETYEVKKGQKIPTTALEKQQLCRELIQTLNAHKDIDLPSWMIEPPRLETSGYYLRSDVIWHKPNPMPESVTDRPTKSHEYIFLLSKSDKYYYDAEAIKESAKVDFSSDGLAGNWARPRIPNDSRERKRYTSDQAGSGRSIIGHSGSYKSNGDLIGNGMANKRSVWTVATQPYSGAHFATFPPQLIEPCVKAGSKKGDIVLDPFAGSGTTMQVARKLERHSVGCDLSLSYLRECAIPRLQLNHDEFYNGKKASGIIEDLPLFSKTQ